MDKNVGRHMRVWVQLSYFKLNNSDPLQLHNKNKTYYNRSKNVLSPIIYKTRCKTIYLKQFKFVLIYYHYLNHLKL